MDDDDDDDDQGRLCGQKRKKGKGVSPHGKATMLFDPAVADDDGDDDGDDGCGDDDRDLGGNDVPNQ